MDDNIYLLSRCDKRKNLESFLYDGILHFSYPINWIEEEKKKGIAGRGDLLEGVYSNVINPNIRRYRNDVEDVESKDKREKFLRSLSVVKWLCLCFYSASDLTDYHQEGDYLVFDMVEAYAEEFSDGENWETRFKTPFEERKAMVVIHRPDVLINKVQNFFADHGLEEDEDYFMRSIRYRTSKSKFVYKQIPKELFYKDGSFRHQQEYRIVLNSESPKVKTMMNGGQEINIGSLEDCAMLKAHFYKGAKIYVKGNDVKLKVVEWSNATGPLHEWEVETLLSFIGLSLEFEIKCIFGDRELSSDIFRAECDRVLKDKYNIAVDYENHIKGIEKLPLKIYRGADGINTIKKNEEKDTYYYLRNYKGYRAPSLEGIFVTRPSGRIDKYTSLMYNSNSGLVVPAS